MHGDLSKSGTRPTGDAATGHDYGAALAPGARSPAAYAASAVASRGRAVAETDCPTRSPFQRDRDRVIHAAAFRRLTHKTQVFLFHEGDHYRSRLTHTLEVAQIARTIARQVRLDEDLAEAIALAHDLGHSPFGHAGERALHRAMSTHGGFDHNAQSIRVVTRLERRYARFDGLNLTWETLEGLAKHNGPVAASAPIAAVVRHLEGWRSLELSHWPGGEAQVAALADDIAYASHDIDDGVRAGLITIDDLRLIPVAGPIVTAVRHDLGRLEESRLVYEVTRRLITDLVADVVAETRRRLADLGPGSPDDIRAASQPIATFSDAVGLGLTGLKAFLFARVYRHDRVMRVMHAAEGIVADLFTRFLDEPSALPPEWQAAAAGEDRRRQARRIADYVAGMTDRHALAEHERLFDRTPELR